MPLALTDFSAFLYASSLGGHEASMGEKAGGLCMWGELTADRICWCADSLLETHPALEERSALMRIQGLCDACVNGKLEPGPRVQGGATFWACLCL